IYAFEVMKQDEFKYQYGLHRVVVHIPARDRSSDPRDLSHVYAGAELTGGGRPFVVMDRAKIEARRRRSASNSGPWTTDYVAMAVKSPIRELRKWIPQSSEMTRAAMLDEAPELGRSQASHFSQEAVNALAHEGFVIDAEAEDVVEDEEDAPASSKSGARSSRPEPSDAGGDEEPDEDERQPGEEG
ncbi:MAG: recombinase RecT, partial [Paracoccus sp. (in: a-proteobacteria)]